MTKKFSDKLKKKKGTLSKGLNKSRAINISENVISVYVLNEDQEKKKNGEKKRLTFSGDRDKRLMKIIDKINLFRAKNKRIDIKIRKLRNRKNRGIKLKDNKSNVKKLKRIGLIRTSNSFINRVRQKSRTAGTSLRKLKK